jgi:hypothetical protein
MKKTIVILITTAAFAIADDYSDSWNKFADQSRIQTLEYKVEQIERQTKERQRIQELDADYDRECRRLGINPITR